MPHHCAALLRLTALLCAAAALLAAGAKGGEAAEGDAEAIRMAGGLRGCLTVAKAESGAAGKKGQEGVCACVCVCV